MDFLPLLGFGQSITLGLMDVLTASPTVFPVPFVAKSIAQACFHDKSMPALSEAIRACIVGIKCPSAR